MSVDNVIILKDYFEGSTDDEVDTPDDEPAHLRLGPIESEQDLRERAESFLYNVYIPKVMGELAP